MVVSLRVSGVDVAFLLGEPLKIFFHPIAIPIYTVGYLLVVFFPGLYRFLLHNEEYLSVPFHLIDSISRGTSIPSFLTRYRLMQVGGYYGHEGLPGQFILGTLAAAGGGLIYIWIFRNNPYSDPGWNLYICMCVVMVNVILLDSYDTTPKFFPWIQSWCGDQCDFTIPELNFMTTLLLFIGFSMRPKERVDDDFEPPAYAEAFKSSDPSLSTSKSSTLDPSVSTKKSSALDPLVKENDEDIGQETPNPIKTRLRKRK